MENDYLKSIPLNSKKIKIDDIHRLIDKMLTLNKIFQISFNDYIMFKESDKEDCKQLINYLFLKFEFNSTKRVLSKQLKTLLSFKFYEKIDVIKLIVFLMYFLYVAYFYQNSNIKFLQYFDILFKILFKMFKDGILNDSDICFFIKYFIVLSTFTPNESYRIGKSIKKPIIFWLALNFFINFFKENQIDSRVILIDNIINFIDSTLLINNLNLIILSRSPQFLGLLDIIKGEKDPVVYIKVFQLISKIYSIQYNLKQHKMILSIINKELSGPNFYSNLQVNSKFLNILSLPLNNVLPINNGFFFTNQPHSGIRISQIISFPSKGYTILFSFKAISTHDNYEQTILSFKEQVTNNRDKETKENQIYRIYIKDSILIIEIQNESFPLIDFPIKNDNFYIVSIVQNEIGFFSAKSKLSITFNNSKNRFEKEMTYPKGKMIRGTIGFNEIFQGSDNKNEKEGKQDKDKEKWKYAEKMHFYGVLGSFLFFEDMFNYDLLNTLYSLGEDYELLLYRSYKFINNIDPKKLEIIKSLNQSENNKLNKLICLISPKSVYNTFLKSNNFFREDFGGFSINNLCVSLRKFEILSNTCIFTIFKFHSLFSNYDGISYLCYILKCLYNYLSNYKDLTNENIDKIWSILFSIIEINFMINLNESQLGLSYKNDIILFFNYLKCIIDQVTNSHSITDTIFESLMKYLYLFDNIPDTKGLVGYLRIKYCELIFDDRLYDTSDTKLILNFLLSFSTFIEKLKNDFITLKTFSKLFNFSKAIFNPNIKNKDLKRHLSLAIKKFIIICCSERKINLVFELIIFAIESKFQPYRCYKLLKIFFISYSENEKLRKMIIYELERKDKNDCFVYIFFNLINFFNERDVKQSQCKLQLKIDNEMICGISIRLIDLFYHNNDNNQISKLNKILTYDEKLEKQEKFSLFEQIIKKFSSIKTGFLAKSIFLFLIDKKNQYVENSNFIHNKNLSRKFLFNDVIILLEPLKILINNLYKFNEIISANSIVNNIKDMFIYICERLIKKYFSKLENDRFEFLIMTTKNVCQDFFTYILLEQNIIKYSDVKICLFDIIKMTINTHSSPFYYDLILNLFLEKYNSIFVIEILDEIKINLSFGVKKQNDKKVISYNLCNLLILLYKMAIYSVNGTIYSDFFNSQTFLQFYLEFTNVLLDTEMIFYINKVFKTIGDKSTMFEIFFDLNFHLYTLIKNEKVLKIFESIYLIKSNKILNNKRAETITLLLDQYYRNYKIKFKSKLDFNRINSYDEIFSKEKNNKINFISLDFLTKFVVFYFYYEKKNDKIQIEMLQSLIISTSRDIVNFLFRLDPTTIELDNFQNIRNFDLLTINQSILKVLYSHFEKNKNCFQVLSPISQEIERIDIKTFFKVLSEMINNNLDFLNKYLENNNLKKRIQDDYEMKSLNLSTFSYFDEKVKTKIIGEFEFIPQIYGDKSINEIEDSLNIILYNSNKYLNKCRLGLFFRENYICDELFQSFILEGFKEKINRITPANTLNLYYFRKDVFTKIKNHFLIGKSYFRPFLKPVKNYLHSRYINFSHSYLVPKIEEYKKFQIKNEFLLQFNIRSQIIFQNKAENISLEGVYFGILSFTNEYLLFESIPEFEYREETLGIDLIFSSLPTDLLKKRKIIIIDFKDIKEILIRRFLLMWQAFEIFLNNGKSYFFNFFKIKLCENAFKIFKKLKVEKNYNYVLIKKSLKYFKKMNYTKKWLDSELSNFDYLCLLNKYSGRSYLDANQYPVFPWILSNYKNPFNLEDKNNFRNLAYTVCTQNESRRQDFIEKYDNDDDSNNSFKVHFRIHYSSSAIVYSYLLRLQPFTDNTIKLQTEKFDNPDRIFFDLEETFKFLGRNHDNREITPEFYYCPEFLVNNNLNYFGENCNNELVHNISLPEWASNPVDFIHKHRLALESRHVSENLNLWIDNIFGSNQLMKCRESLNVFPKCTYEQEMNLSKKLKKYIAEGYNINIIHGKIKNKIENILNLGQTPHKLFEEKHPRKLVNKIYKGEIMANVDFLFTKTHNNLISFPKGIKYFDNSKNLWYILTTEKEVEIFDKSFKKKTKIRLKVNEKMNVLRIKILNHNAKILINKEKYRIIELKDSKIFISCGHLDQSIKIYSNDNIDEYHFGSLVTSLLKDTDEKILYTGHNNGKLCIWNINISDSNSLSFNLINEFIAHDEAITCIYLNTRLGLILSGSEDGTVSIRNADNYEVINYIMPKIDSRDNKKYKIIDIKISEFNWIYFLAFESESFYIFGYTLSGIKFSHTVGLINNFEFTPNLGNLIVGYYTNQICVLNAVDLNPIFTKSLDDIHCFVLYYFSYKKDFYLGYGDGNLYKWYLEDDKKKHFL